MARPRTRAKNERFKVEVFSKLGHRLLAAVPWSEVRRKLDDGTAEIKTLRDASGRKVGEQIRLTVLASDERNSPCAMSFGEMEGLVGARGSAGFHARCRDKFNNYDPNAVMREVLCAST